MYCVQCVVVQLGYLRFALMASFTLVCHSMTVKTKTRMFKTNAADPVSFKDENKTLTRKPCYRKGDRTMRCTCAWPGQFRKSLATPMATIPEIVTGLLLRCIVWKCVQNQKFVAFYSSWDNSGYFQILGSPWIRPRFLVPQIFNGLLFGWTLWIYQPN